MTNEQIERMIEAQNNQIAEVWKMFAETREQFKETREHQQKTDDQIFKVSMQMAETDKKLKNATTAFGNLVNCWGDFVEGIVAPGIKKVFQERGIVLKHIHRQSVAFLDAEEMEIDILAVNEKYVLAVEIKSTLSQEDVEAHLEKLERFKLFFPIYAEKTLLGAVAGIVMARQVTRHAYKKGLFVLGQAGDNIAILNDAKFCWKEW